MYIYTPGEPRGNPYQPGENVNDDDNNFYFAHLSLFTTGRCGNCLACPKVWKLEVPDGNSVDAAYWGGTYYLRRDPYNYDGSFSTDEGQHCSFSQIVPEPIQGANQHHGIDGTVWSMRFMLDQPHGILNWLLFTPNDGDSLVSGMSLYQFVGSPSGWACLNGNTFRYAGRVGETDFNYLPAHLTVEPFYA